MKVRFQSDDFSTKKIEKYSNPVLAFLQFAKKQQLENFGQQIPKDKARIRQEKNLPSLKVIDDKKIEHIRHKGKKKALSKKKIINFKSGIGTNRNSIMEERQNQKKLDIHKLIIKQYQQLADLYETNQWKLVQLIEKELIAKKYLYSSQLFDFIKNKNCQTPENINEEVFNMEAFKLFDFLVEFNAKKKIKKIEIIKESMENREKMIRKSVGCNEYYQMYKFIRSPMSTNQGFTIYDQLRFIEQSDYSIMPKKSIEMLEKVCKKMQQAEQQVYQIIREQAMERKSKRDKFIDFSKDK